MEVKVWNPLSLQKHLEGINLCAIQTQPMQWKTFLLTLSKHPFILKHHFLRGYRIVGDCVTQVDLMIRWYFLKTVSWVVIHKYSLIFMAKLLILMIQFSIELCRANIASVHFSSLEFFGLIILFKVVYKNESGVKTHFKVFVIWKRVHYFYDCSDSWKVLLAHTKFKTERMDKRSFCTMQINSFFQLTF